MKEHLGALAVWLVAVVAFGGPNHLQARQPAGKLHALLVLDTLDSALGSQLHKDKENMERFLKNGIGIKAGGQMKLDVLEDEKATWPNVLDYFRKLRVAPEDTVLCYFSGHGGTVKDAGKEHLLKLEGTHKAELFERSKLRKAMLATNARLVVLLTDSCSDYVPARNAGPRYLPKGIHEEMRPAFRRLFFEEKGLVDINAAYEGSMAWSDDSGGLFTRHLLNTFEKQADNAKASWKHFAATVREGTEIEFKSWKQEAIGTLGGRNDRQAKELRTLLEGQHTQAPQFYHIPGASLGVVVAPTGGKGVRVVGFLYGSPMERAGIKREEDTIVGVAVGDKVARIYTTNDWNRVMDPLLLTVTAFTFTVRGADKTERQVRVALEP